MLKDILKLQDKCNTGNDRAITIMSMRNYLARRNSTIIWGNGAIFESENENLEQFWTKYQRKYRLLELFCWIENHLSLYGRVMITLNKTKDGEWKCLVPDLLYNNQIGKSFYTEELAVIYQRPIDDIQGHWIKTTYTKTKIINEIYYQQDDGKIKVWDKDEPLPKSCKLEKEIIHNLGFVPVVELTNFPLFGYNPLIINWISTADWFNSIPFEKLFYQAIKDLKKELILNHSRVLVENATQQLLQNIEDKVVDYEDDNDNILKDYVIDGGVGGKATVINGVPDFTKYAQIMDLIMDFYCKFANSSRFSEGGSAQKTSQEAKTNRAAQVEAINTKILFREQRISELIAKILACYGLINYDEDWDFTFKINGNIQKEETTFLDNILKQVNLGTMSMVEAISKLRNVPLSRAEEIFTQIKEFNDENDMITQMAAGDDMEGEGFGDENPNGDNPNTGGRPKDIAQ